MAEEGGGDHCNDDHDHVDDQFDKILEVEGSMEMLRERMIAADLGEDRVGYDEETLLGMDRKLASHFLANDDFDDDGEESCSEGGKKERVAGDKINDPSTEVSELPTTEEIRHYEKSIQLRISVLKKAFTHEVIINTLSDNDHLNRSLYMDLFLDMKKFPYAWFGIIFTNREKLHDACSALRALKNLARLEWKDRSIDTGAEILTMYKRALNAFESTICKSKEERYNDDMGEFLSEEYDLKCVAAEITALYKTRKDLSVRYFKEALDLEDTWQCGRYCRDVIEFATGETVSKNDLFDMYIECDDHHEDDDDNNNFLYDCIRAKLQNRRGTVARNRSTSPPSCENCMLSEEDFEPRRKLQRCGRCKSVFYCSRRCQKEDWIEHKLNCEKMMSS